MVLASRPQAVFRLARLITLAVAIAPFCGGCALIPVATLGAVFDIAGAAVSTGPAVYAAGKLDTAFMADSSQVEDAVRRAAADLHLKIVHDCSQSKRGDVWLFQLEDDWKSRIEVNLERRTPTLCRCRVNVGLFGSEPTARLVMGRIELHLPPTPVPPATSNNRKLPA